MVFKDLDKFIPALFIHALGREPLVYTPVIGPLLSLKYTHVFDIFYLIFKKYKVLIYQIIYKS